MERSSAKAILDRLLSMTALFENDDDRLTINVSGTQYEINAADLFNFPDTILGDPLQRARYLVPGTNEYFFARHASSFESILYYYINDGVLIKPETVPALIFYEEIRFFRLNDELIQIFYNEYLAVNEDTNIEPEHFMRTRRWTRLARPLINGCHALFNILSAIFNALAIYCLCLETISAYRHIYPTVWMITYPLKTSNRTQDLQCSQMKLRPYQYLPYADSENVTLEMICVTWSVERMFDRPSNACRSVCSRFYFELLVRTLSRPSLIVLLTDVHFLLDILSILPTFISQMYHRRYLSTYNERLTRPSNETQLFDYLTCLKLFRLFRLTRHAKCLEILIQVLYMNVNDLLMLTILIAFGTFYFGLTQFVLEQIHPDNEIHSIGEALWHVKNSTRRTSRRPIDTSRTANTRVLPCHCLGLHGDRYRWLFGHSRTWIAFVFVGHRRCLVRLNIHGNRVAECHTIV
jgi:hypothetical protein